MANILSERIAELRRERGLTQEQLGQPLGVSAQAVSKWEKGGAPDVELLPALADRLGVSIDALFGREGGVVEDIPERFCRYLSSQPEGKRLDTLCRAVYQCIQFIMPSGLWHEPIAYPEKCFVDADSTPTMMRSGLQLEEGIVFGVGSEEFSFMTLFPEPQKGWAAYFADKDLCRKLFAVLARDGSLELLEMLYSDKEHYLVPEVTAARLGRPREETASLFAAMHEVHLLRRLEMELESGMIYTYSINENYGYIPFMLITRCLLESDIAFYLQWIDRHAPLLRKPQDNIKEGKQS